MIDRLGGNPYSPLPLYRDDSFKTTIEFAQKRGDNKAEVAELVDALGSGLSWGNPVEVQVLSSVPD
jgi:hypothetical protein